MVTIRRFRPDDAPALWSVYFSAIRETAARDYSPEQIAAWAPESFDESRWAQRMAGIAPFVAERDGAVVGYADVQATGCIDHFFVAGHAGRQGVGSQLMQQIHAHAGSVGLTSLFADVSITARPFFEHWGFTRRAEGHVQEAGTWWRANRTKAPGVGQEIGLVGRDRRPNIRLQPTAASQARLARRW